jgi:hypothetical protein
MNLIPTNGSYLDALKLKSKEEQNYLFILNKLNETLDVYDIKNKRDAFSEALIRLVLLEADLPMHPNDEETKIMFSMVDYFKQAVNK